MTAPSAFALGALVACAHLAWIAAEVRRAARGRRPAPRGLAVATLRPLAIAGLLLLPSLEGPPWSAAAALLGYLAARTVLLGSAPARARTWRWLRD